MAIPLTANKVVVLRTLEAGPSKWSVLRREYFGEGRAKEQASTSFYMQIQGMIKKDLVTKTAAGYEITDLGTESLEAARSAGFDVDGAKSKAQTEWEAKQVILSAAAPVSVPDTAEAV